MRAASRRGRRAVERDGRGDRDERRGRAQEKRLQTKRHGRVPLEAESRQRLRRARELAVVGPDLSVRIQDVLRTIAFVALAAEELLERVVVGDVEHVDRQLELAPAEGDVLAD